MRSPNDSGERIVTLTALSIAYRMTENRLLERIIPLMQRDTKRWLRQHPEHVHAFCDGYYERRDEAIALACEMTDEAMGDWDGLDINGVWTVLGARHESRLAHEQRAADAGFVTLDIDEMLERHFSPEEVAQIKAESEAMLQAEKEAHAKGPDPDARMHYSFWLPDRLENYGEFDVGIPQRHRWRMERIGDYRYAGARFPVRDYTAFFDELRAEGVLSEEEHHNLMRWIAYESQPKGKREADKRKSPYRPITDVPGLKEKFSLFSEFDNEPDDLDEGELSAITQSRLEAEAVVGKLIDAVGGKTQGEHDET